MHLLIPPFPSPFPKLDLTPFLLSFTSHLEPSLLTSKCQCQCLKKSYRKECRNPSFSLISHDFISCLFTAQYNTIVQYIQFPSFLPLPKLPSLCPFIIYSILYPLSGWLGFSSSKVSSAPQSLTLRAFTAAKAGPSIVVCLTRNSRKNFISSPFQLIHFFLSPLFFLLNSKSQIPKRMTTGLATGQWRNYA